MVRTAVNVTGDATVSLIVAKSEGKFDERVFLNPQADLVPELSEEEGQAAA